jgi:hypothetical protein
MARRHFTSLALYTDDEGARLLIDELGLAFDHISVSLNSLNSADSDWWMQGKLLTYSQQQEPFVHIDSDVYLFNPLPARITSAPVLAQNPEPVNEFSPWYDAEACATAILAHGNGCIPEEWTWYQTLTSEQHAACCGIFGGHQLDFIRHYSSMVLRLLQDNRHAFDHLSEKRELNAFFEQYMLAACAKYHQVTIEYLFDGCEQAISGAPAAGFTHLMGASKRDPNLAARVERRVAREWPEAYERCRALF